MKLSIVTVNKDNAAGLEKTLASIVEQTATDFEFIVVDGASTDGSVQTIEKYSQHPAMRWLSEPDSGIYNAMNKGIRMSSGEYLLFLNSGDMFADDQVVAKVLSELTGEDFIFGNIYHSDKLGVKAFKEKYTKGRDMAFMLTTSSLPHQSTFIHRSVFDRYGFYREDLRIVSDWEKLMDVLVFRHGSFRYIPIVISIYDTGGISSSNKKLYNNEMRKVFNDWHFSKHYLEFFRENYEKISFLNNNKFLFGLFRLFYYFRPKTRDVQHDL